MDEVDREGFPGGDDRNSVEPRESDGEDTSLAVGAARLTGRETGGPFRKLRSGQDAAESDDLGAMLANVVRQDALRYLRFSRQLRQNFPEKNSGWRCYGFGHVRTSFPCDRLGASLPGCTVSTPGAAVRPIGAMTRVTCDPYSLGHM